MEEESNPPSENNEQINPNINDATEKASAANKTENTTNQNVPTQIDAANANISQSPLSAADNTNINSTINQPINNQSASEPQSINNTQEEKSASTAIQNDQSPIESDQIMHSTEDQIQNDNINSTDSYYKIITQSLISNQNYKKLRFELNKVKDLGSNPDCSLYNKYFNESLFTFLKNIIEFNAVSTPLDNIFMGYYFLLHYIKLRLIYAPSDNLSIFECQWYLYYLEQGHCLYRNNLNSIDENKIEEITKFVLVEDLTNPKKSPEPIEGPLLSTEYTKIQYNNLNILFKYLLEFLYRIDFYSQMTKRLIIPYCDIENFFTIYCRLVNLLFMYDDNHPGIKASAIDLLKHINCRYNDILTNPDKELNKMQVDVLFSWNLAIDLNLGFLLKEEDISENNDELILLFTKDMRICYKYLQSNNLEKRVIGLKNIEYLCGHLMDFESKESNLNPIFVGLYYKKINLLTEFFEKINIFNMIYGENIHEAVVQKSSMILKYLYQKNKINFEHIMFLWKLSQEKHQSISASILTVFSHLIPIFSIDHAKYILKIINDLNLKEVNDVTLKIIESFGMKNDAAKSSDSSNDFKDLLLKILMKFSNEYSHYNGISSQIILKARKVLCDVLLLPSYKHYLYKYVKKCIYGIGCNQTLSTHLNILDMLLMNIKHKQNINQSLNVFGNEVKDYPTFIAFLEKKYTLTSTILTALLDLKKEILFFASELIEIQRTSLNSNSMFSVQEIMNDYEMKYDQCLNSIEPLPSSTQHNNEACQNMNISSENISNIEINQHQILKLDITQSTEKSIDNDDDQGSVSSVSTDISAQERARALIIQNFLDAFAKEIKDKNFLFNENYEFIFNKLRLNFMNNNYHTLTLSLLSFLKNIIFSTNINLTQSHIQYLHIIFVENAVDEEEKNLFYNFFAEVIHHQLLTKENYIAEDNIIYIFFELLIKPNLAGFPLAGYTLFNNIFFLINTTHGNLIHNGSHIIDVQNFNQLVGLDTLWTFYLTTTNPSISNESLNLLVNLISTLGKHDDETCKNNFNMIFDKIFERLKDCSKLLQNNSNDIETQENTKKLLNLLFIINTTKQKLENKNREILSLVISNNYSSNNLPTETIQIGSDSTVKELKAMIIDKVMAHGDEIFRRSIEETGILVNWKGKILKDKFLLKDYKIESGHQLLIFKDDPAWNMEINPETIQIGLIQIKDMFCDYSDEILKCCLKKCYGNVDQAIDYLMVESNIETLMQEVQEDNIGAQMNQINSVHLELFTEDKLNLLIQLLEIGVVPVNGFIWKLLSAIKYPDEFIEPITSMQFDKIFNIEHKSRLLLYLKLINSIIFGERFFQQIKILPIDESKSWIHKLLNSEGIEMMFKAIEDLIDVYQAIQNTDIKDKDCLQTIILSLHYIIKLLHYFMFTCSSALTFDNEKLKILKDHIVKNRPSTLDIGIVIHSNPKPKEESKRPMTPVFGPQCKPIEEPAPKPQNNKEDNDINNIVIDEDSSKSFMFKLVNFNFHSVIFKFIHYISNTQYSQIPNTNQEPVIILISLIEILTMYNEINSEGFTYTITSEVSSCELINLLFTERNKPIRNIIENFFLVLLQSSKSIDLKTMEIINKPAKEIIANHIFNNYKKIYSSGAYEEFFNLFGYILTHEKEFNCDNLGNFNFKDLTDHILSKIYQGSNQNDLSDMEQEQLTGYVHLLHCLSTSRENIIIESIEKMSNMLDPISLFYNFLFDINATDSNTTNKPSYNNIKFKYSNKNLRQKCYNLLLSFMRLKDSFKDQLISKMITHHNKLLPSTNILPDFDIPFREKDNTFIGLKNYGATCYLNSLCQQLFMMPSFIQSIFSFKINPKEEENIHLNPIYQLQLAYANLKSTLRQYYPPITFIQSIKTAFNGEPIALNIQQDSDEFFAIITDVLEKQAKVYNKENFLEQSFKGKISNEIISLEKECPYYNATDESCIRITLDIKNQRSLEDALDFFQKEEILEGENKYFVEKHNKKLSISKRYLIKQLGQNVIIHLKRFEFDYERFENCKLNDYIAFPHEIDFRRWMRSTIITNNKNDERYKDVLLDEEELKELNDTESYKYVLTGVLIHSGSTLQHGHYYSFIMDQATGKWYRFDDKNVKEFNPQNLEQECFGENKENKNADNMRCQNAYLLFYTKKSAIGTIDLNDKVPNEINEMIHKENVDFLKMKTYVDNDYYVFVKGFIDYVISKEKKNPDNDNNDSIIENYVHEHSMPKISREMEEIYQMVEKIKGSSSANINDIDIANADGSIANNKLNEILNKCKAEIMERQSFNKLSKNNQLNQSLVLQKEMIKFGLYYYFEIILNQNEKNKVTSFANFLRDLLFNNPLTSLWFIKKIEDNRPLFFNNIIINTTDEIRYSMQYLIFTCLYSIYKTENKWINDIYYYYDQNSVVQTEYRSSIMRLMKNVILPNFDISRHNWQRHYQFFSLITEILDKIPATLSLMEYDNTKLYFKLIYFIMNNKGNFKTNLPTMGNSVISFNIYFAVEMLTTIILSSITPGIKHISYYSKYSKNQSNSKDFKHLFLPTGWEIILQRDVIAEAILRTRTSDMENQLVHHLSYADEKTSKSIIHSIMSTLRDNFKDNTSVYNLLMNTRGLFEIDDKYRRDRCQWFFLFDNDSDSDLSPLFDYLYCFRDDMPFNTLLCLRHVAQIIQMFDYVKDYIVQHREQIIWIHYFLSDIEKNDTKKSVIQIECTAENISFQDIYMTTYQVYMNVVGISNHVQSEYQQKVNESNSFNILS